MTHSGNLYLLAFVAAVAASAFSLPAWRAWCRRTGLVDDPGRRKIHNMAVPLAGGFAVLTGLLFPLAVGFAATRMKPASHWLGVDAMEALGYGFGRRQAQLLAVLVGAVGMTVLGWLDDKQELRPARKFLGQFLLSLLTAAAGVRITLFVPSVLFSYVITVLWILTITNAFNFMDNMNGLCAGLGAISSAGFAMNAALHGQYLVALLALLVCGALLGFLPYNFPRASAFLGDAGSHLAGYLMAVLAILPHFYTAKHPRVLAVFLPLLILAVPLADLAWVVILRWRLGQPFYIGDNNHLSHRLLRRGLSQIQAVLAIWLLAALGTALALWLG